MSVIAWISLFLYLGPSEYVISSRVPKENRKVLIIRLLAGVANITTANTVTKYFKLSTVSVLMNTTPLLTLSIGVSFFGEKASKIDVACIILSFFGVMCMTFAIIQNKDS
jgi:drug/metabolite transporter (DMT)-like permease